MVGRLMMAAKAGAFSLACMLASVASAMGNVSAPTFLDTDVSSMHWSVIHDRTVPLVWAYPAGSDSVVLTIDNALGERVLSRNFVAPQESFDWTVFESASVNADDCFMLTLTFSDSTVETTRLALLRGAFGPTEIRAEDRKWSMVRERCAVVPYGVEFFDGASGAANLTVDDRNASVRVCEQTGMAGWFGWRGRGGEVFDLSMTEPGGMHLASAISFLFSGTVFSVR